MREVIVYLDKVDPVAAARARQRYACFDHTSADDGQAYGFAAAFGAGLSCEREAIEQLVEIQRNALAYARRDGLLAEDEMFYAEQNAQTVRNAEVYYRAMFSGRVTSWNLPDTHMAQTLEAMLAHMSRHPSTAPWAARSRKRRYARHDPPPHIAVISGRLRTGRGDSQTQGPNQPEVPPRPLPLDPRRVRRTAVPPSLQAIAIEPRLRLARLGLVWN